MNHLATPAEVEITFHALQVFEPDSNAVHTIETVAQMTRISRHEIGVYCKEGLISPLVDAEDTGYRFNDETIRVLRRIERLRDDYGLNVAGIKMMLDLASTVDRLQEEVRFLRG